MNRRDFAKGLAVLPFARTVKSSASICGTSSCPTVARSLRVILEGPFALVIKTASPWRVRAFTPRYTDEHFFSFNGIPCDKDYKYRMQLSQTGLAPASAEPCIDKIFQHFCVDNTTCRPSVRDHFITIDLPGPQRIFSLSSGIQATMEDGNKWDFPGDHVLEYQITDPLAIQMYGWYDDDPVALKTYMLDGYPTFKFEVGLPQRLGGGDSDPDGAHAVDFFNNGLLSYFPQLSGDVKRRIKQVSGGHKTTTLECKSGGLISGTS